MTPRQLQKQNDPIYIVAKLIKKEKRLTYKMNKSAKASLTNLNCILIVSPFFRLHIQSTKISPNQRKQEYV
jgi:hypothetical protein